MLVERSAPAHQCCIQAPDHLWGWVQCWMGHGLGEDGRRVYYRRERWNGKWDKSRRSCQQRRSPLSVSSGFASPGEGSQNVTTWWTSHYAVGGAKTWVVGMVMYHHPTSACLLTILFDRTEKLKSVYSITFCSKLYHMACNMMVLCLQITILVILVTYCVTLPIGYHFSKTLLISYCVIITSHWLFGQSVSLDNQSHWSIMN